MFEFIGIKWKVKTFMFTGLDVFGETGDKSIYFQWGGRVGELQRFRYSGKETKYCLHTPLLFLWSLCKENTHQSCLYSLSLFPPLPLTPQSNPMEFQSLYSADIVNIPRDLSIAKTSGHSCFHFS